MTISPKLVRARSALILSQPFFGSLALHLGAEERTDIETMATDGRKLFYNPAFVESLEPRELEGVIAHEVLHCAYSHMTRRGTRDHTRWNEAADYAINRDLIAAGFRLPDGALIDPRFDGMGAEEIYRARVAQQSPQGGQPKPGGNRPGQPQQGASGAPGQPGNDPAQAGAQPGQDGAGNDPGRCGAVLDAAPDHDESAKAQAAAEWQSRVRQAIAVAKAQGAGKIPAALDRIVQSLAAPRVDWRAILRRFVDESQSRDYSWLRPNRRHIAAGRYFPGYVPDRPSHIAVMIDTSGSIQDSDVAAFASEMQAVLDEGAADRITVAYADTKVKASESFEAGDVLALHPKGGGGTSFRQPLEWLSEQCDDASAILYMTDADCRDWGEEPAAPILWIVTGEARQAHRMAARAPFGESLILAD